MIVPLFPSSCRSLLLCYLFVSESICAQGSLPCPPSSSCSQPGSSLCSGHTAVAFAGPACWLWDFMRRSGASGYLVPLSGGADSASVAAIVGCMCQLAVKAVQVLPHRTRCAGSADAAWVLAGRWGLMLRSARLPGLLVLSLACALWPGMTPDCAPGWTLCCCTVYRPERSRHADWHLHAERRRAGHSRCAEGRAVQGHGAAGRCSGSCRSALLCSALQHCAWPSIGIPLQ